MNTALLYYTNNLLPSPLLNESLSRVFDMALENDCSVMVSSHYPVTSHYVDISDDPFLALSREGGFEFNELIDQVLASEKCERDNVDAVVTGRLAYSPATIIRQIIDMLRRTDCDKVLLMEHDVFYPPNYVADMSAALDDNEFALYDNYVFIDSEGFFGTDTNFRHLSRYGARCDALEDFFVTKLEDDRFAILEPVLMQFFSGDPDEDLVKGTVIDGPPVLDIKHGANATGQIIVGDHSLMNSEWGFHPHYGYLFDDPIYDAFLSTDPTLGYGLFRLVL